MEYDDFLVCLKSDGSPDFETAHSWQIEACRDMLDELPRLFDEVPEGTRIVLTADHGELFGEEDRFGHNFARDAVFHEKIFEVPLLTWVVGERGEEQPVDQDIPEHVRERLAAQGYLD